jgi:hypothetical protein
VAQSDFESNGGLVTIHISATAQPLPAGSAALASDPAGSVQLTVTRLMEVTVNLDATAVASAGERPLPPLGPNAGSFIR